MKKGVFTEFVDGNFRHVYNHNGNIITNVAGSCEVTINGKIHQLEKPFENQKEFYIFCIETDLY